MSTKYTFEPLNDSSSSATSWNDLIDRPFGETVITGDTRTVDYNTFDGNVTVVVNGITFVKVADVVPTLADFANGCSAIVSNQTIAYTHEELSQSNTDNGYIVTDSFAIVPSDWFGVGSGDNYVEFPKKGVYFVKNSTTALTIPNYTGFVTTTIQKIDAKYLPEGSGSSGGLSIKKIEFTDRPSLYEWLNNNVGKVIKLLFSYNQFPAPVTFPIVATLESDHLYYQFIELLMEQTVMTHLTFVVDSDITKLWEGKVNDLAGETEVPDEYWAAFEVLVTVYYID